MRNLYKIISICFIFIFMSGYYVLANENDSMQATKDKIENDSRVENFYNYINNLEIEEEILDGLSAKEYISNYLSTGEDPISLQKIGNAIISLLFKEVKIILKLIMSILVIALLSALLKNLQDAFSSSEEVTSIAFFACYAMLIMLLSKSFLVSLDIAKEVMMSVIDFMNVLLPVLVFLIGTAGGVTSALTIDPIVITTVLVTPKIYINFVFPLILIYFALQFANNLTKEFNIGKICKFIKQTILVSQGFMITIFVGILSIRGMTANTLDAVTVKTIKFAMDNFIPFVGKAFGDVISTVAGYSLAMKSVISALGVLVIVAIVIYPIIKIFVMTVAFRLTGAILEPVTDSRISDSITMVGDSLTMIMSCIITISIMFFIMAAMMASTGKFIIGG